MLVQVVAILMIVAVHDALFVMVGCVLANKFYGLSPDASHVALNQALRVYSNPTHGNPFRSFQRYCVSHTISHAYPKALLCSDDLPLSLHKAAYPMTETAEHREPYCVMIADCIVSKAHCCLKASAGHPAYA